MSELETKYSADDMLNQEESLLRVPQEQMRKTFKTAQKYLEKETKSIIDSSKDEKNLDEMIKRARGLKRKIRELKDEMDEHVNVTQARVDHVKQLCQIPSANCNEFEEWSADRLNVLLVEYFLRNGYLKTAQKQAKLKNIEQLVDSSLLKECYNIRQSLLNHQTGECVAWCQENKSHLKKLASSLEFQVRMQYSIELIKQNKTTEAVQYNRKYLAKSADTQMNEIQQASALLAFGPDTNVQQYKDFFSDHRWSRLADQFTDTFFNMYGLPEQSLLAASLAIGMSALKTPSCLDSTERERKPRIDLSRGHMCPICSVELNQLSKPLPHANHARCQLDPDPVVLPNLNIYGKAELLAYSSKAGVEKGKVCDPVSLEIFEESELSFVYPT